MASPTELLAKPWPLTGRHEDLDAVCAAIEGGSHACFLIGEAGTGKTRLAREVLRRLAADGWPTAGATATESARATPLGALAHLVPAAAIDSPQSVFGATRDAIAADGGDRPLVLHVDDAHHLDPASAVLLVNLAEAGVVRLVLTLRLGAGAPDALAALRGRDDAVTLTVGDLDPLAVDTLLHRVLGAPLDGMAASELVRASGGNPLYLRELVISAVADGALRDVVGVWRLDGSFPTSEALSQRLLERLAVLDDEARQALDLVALAEPIGLALLEQLADPVALEDLEHRGLLRVDADRRRNQVQLAHPVYGEVLRSTMGRVRRRRLSRTLVEAVGELGARRAGDPAALVRWQIDAGITPDVDVVMAGARLACHYQDWPTTSSLAGAALAAGEADAAALAAEAHYALGEFAEGDAIIANALTEPDALSAEALVQLHRIRANGLFFVDGDSTGAVAALQAIAPTVSDPELQDLLRLSEASMLAWLGRVLEAEAVVTDLLESGGPRVAVQASLTAELVSATSGPTGRALELAETWFPVHAGLPDLAGLPSPGFHVVISTVALASAGRLQEAATLAETGYQASLADRNLAGQLWFALELGRISLLRGDAAAAQRWYREQVALCRATGWLRPITLGLSGLAMASAHLGDAVAATEAIAERDRSGQSVLEIFATEAARGTAWALSVSGDPEGARRVLVEAAQAAEASGITLLAALTRVDALRLGATDQADPLVAAAEVVDSEIVSLAARWATRPNDAQELEAVAAGFEALGALVLAAEVSAAAGAAWRRAGEPRRGAAAEQRADAVASQVQGIATPALTTIDAPVPLTAREREIAVLVADGLPTKEVADRLYLSSRTVSNHLQNIYAKLGITRRAELAAALGRFGAPTLEPNA